MKDKKKTYKIQRNGRKGMKKKVFVDNLSAKTTKIGILAHVIPSF